MLVFGLHLAVAFRKVLGPEWGKLCCFLLLKKAVNGMRTISCENECTKYTS